MKRLALIILLLCSSLLHATTWYATTSSANMDAVTWRDATTGSCTGSGATLTWANRLNGDVFNANGCTAIAVNVDPGSASIHVTLTTDTTQGGAFTYATASNLTIHADITATKTAALTITGSTNGGTIIGNLAGGSAASAYGVSDGHTVVTVNVAGNLTGGSQASGYAYYASSSGPVAITGNASAATADGLRGNASAAITITGNCSGSDTIAAYGCNASGTGAITVTGNIVNGKRGGGATGTILFTPAAGNYVLSPKDASYVLGVIDSHATEMPTNPGVANVRTGTSYGSFTGTLAGGVCAGDQGWR